MLLRYLLLNTVPLFGMPEVLREGEGTGGNAGGNNPPPPPATAPWGTDVNSEWKVADKLWYDYLPDGPSKDLMKTKNYKNPVQVADAYYSANRMINGNVVEIPNADAPPEQWNSVYQKLGAQTDPAKYEIKVKDGVQADPRLIEFSKKSAAKNGLTPKQIQGVVDDWIETVPKWDQETVAEQQRVAQEKNAAELNAIKDKWGTNFDTNITTGKRVASALFDVNNKDANIANAEKAMMSKIEESIGAAAMLELFARIGAKSAEGTFTGNPGGSNVNNPDNMDPQTAKGEIDRLNADSEFQKKYTDKDNSQHAWAVEHMSKLYARAGKLVS